MQEYHANMLKHSPPDVVKQRDKERLPDVPVPIEPWPVLMQQIDHGRDQQYGSCSGATE